jgi:DNA-binding NtrC family response regulator
MKPEERHLYILISHYDEEIRLLFKGTVESMGHQLMITDSSIGTLRYLKKIGFDLIFLDSEIATVDDAKVLHEIAKLDTPTNTIIVTDYPHGETILKILEQGNFKLMKKPSTVLEITKAINEEVLALD